MPTAKHILVVGGNSGIGRHLVDQFLVDGHQISALCRDGSDLEALGVTVVPFEATNAGPITEGIPERLDGLVYCPGSITLKPFHRTTEADFLTDYQINVVGAVRVLQAALPALRGGIDPAVVLFSSVAAGTGLGFHSSIASAKAAVEGLVRSLAAEWAPTIRVNGIAPSLTNTPLAGALLGSDAKLEAAGQRHPLQRIGDPADLAALAKMLLSPESKFVSGQILTVDGGMSALRTFG